MNILHLTNFKKKQVCIRLTSQIITFNGYECILIRLMESLFNIQWLCKSYEAQMRLHISNHVIYLNVHCCYLYPSIVRSRIRENAYVYTIDPIPLTFFFHFAGRLLGYQCQYLYLEAHYMLFQTWYIGINLC